MSIRQYSGSAWVETRPRKNTAGDTFSEVRARISDAWVTVWRALTATVTGEFFPEGIGLGRARDRGTFSVHISPNSTPSAYLWTVFDSAGGLSYGSTTSPTLLLTGPAYMQGESMSYSVQITCRVTIAGVQYETPTITRSYNAGLI